MSLPSWLNGKKTYLVAVAIGLVAVGQHLGWIDSATAQTLFGLLGAGGFAAVRSGLTREIQSQQPTDRP